MQALRRFCHFAQSNQPRHACAMCALAASIVRATVNRSRTATAIDLTHRQDLRRPQSSRLRSVIGDTVGALPTALRTKHHDTRSRVRLEGPSVERIRFTRDTSAARRDALERRRCCTANHAPAPCKRRPPGAGRHGPEVKRHDGSCTTRHGARHLSRSRSDHRELSLDACRVTLGR